MANKNNIKKMIAEKMNLFIPCERELDIGKVEKILKETGKNYIRIESDKKDEKEYTKIDYILLIIKENTEENQQIILNKAKENNVSLIIIDLNTIGEEGIIASHIGVFKVADAIVYLEEQDG